ncbi:hypothetical protein GCM10009634_10780 [Saccharothrix xinjiangensis]
MSRNRTRAVPGLVRSGELLGAGSGRTCSSGYFGCGVKGPKDLNFRAGLVLARMLNVLQDWFRGPLGRGAKR